MCLSFESFCETETFKKYKNLFQSPSSIFQQHTKKFTSVYYVPRCTNAHKKGVNWTTASLQSVNCDNLSTTRDCQGFLNN
ncbi:MAG: hypothetical protein ACKPKO_13555 [Candidatus Fonsibacter sp.]